MCHGLPVTVVVVASPKEEAVRSGIQRLLTVLCLFIALSGCAGPRNGVREDRLPRERIVYESQGWIMAEKTFGPHGKEQVLLWEQFDGNASYGTFPFRKRLPEDVPLLRLVRLDLPARKARVAWEGISDALLVPSDYQVAASADGRRLAAAGGTDPAHPYPTPDEMFLGSSGVFVSDDCKPWIPLIPSDNHVRWYLEWSPNADALAYLSMVFDGSGLASTSTDLVVLSVSRPARRTQEISLTPRGGKSIGFAWAPDGRRIYHVVYRPDRDESYIEVVQWPSLERHTFMTAGALGRVSVARQTGDIVFLRDTPRDTKQPADTESGHALRTFWRISSDGRIEKTPVELERSPFAAEVSPDGKRLAVIPMAQDDRPELRPHGEGLIVYSLEDGSSNEFPRFAQTPIVSVAWVYGGKSLVFVEGDTRVWLVAPDGSAPNIPLLTPRAGLFTARPPAAVLRDALVESESRSNLEQLATAVMSYAEKHDCALPDLSDMDSIKEVLCDYVESDDVLLNPRTGKPYGVNSALSRKRCVDTEYFFDAVLFYEAAPAEDGGRNVAFAGGHVARVSADRWREIKPSPATP